MKVSVVIPLYNKEKYIAECIQSVLHQTQLPDEIIIIDDCSTDNSVSIVNSFTDKRIKFFINKENLGTAKIANRCMDLAGSGIMIRQDADDIMPIDRIEQQVKYLKNNLDVAIVSGKNQRINEKHLNYINLNEEEIKNELFFTNSISQPAAAFNLDLIFKENIKYEDEGPSIGEDWLFFYKLSKKLRLVNVNQVFNYYRIHEGNISSFENSKYNEDIEKVIRFIFKDNNIEINDDELNAHLLFRRKINCDNYSKLVLDFHSWSKRLISLNSIKASISPIYLMKRIEDAKSFLFYSIYDNKNALEEFKKYFPLNSTQRKFLIKLRIKKLLGFK